ncbi:hypothetical protein ACLKA6_012187 [Drosophila palustris]
MSDFSRGLLALLKYGFYLQVFGAALVFIIVSVLLLLFLGELKDIPRDASCWAAIILVSLALILFNVYVNVLRFRRKFPANWIFCCTIAFLLALGNAFLLPAQDGEDFVWVLEVMALMCLYLLLGLWLPPQCPPLLYIALTSFIICALVFFCLLFLYRNCEECNMSVLCVDGAMWVGMCPIMLFQAQVIYGYQQTIRPFFDIPLCSVLLLIDFIACYTFLTGIEDVIMAVEIFSASNQKMMGDVASFYAA